MQYATFLKNTLAIGASILMFSACKKVVTPEPMGDAGITIVKFIDGLADTSNGYSSGYKSIDIDLISTSQTVEAVDIRRDAPNNTELNRDMMITVKNDPGAVTAYDPLLTPMPDGSFSADPSTPLIGTDYKVTMKAGEFAKIIKIVIPNILLLDITKTYALGFTISAVDANGKIAAMEKSIVVAFGLKNKWDGKYQINTVSFVDLSNAALIGYNSWKADLKTSGAYTNIAYLTGVIGSPDLATTAWLNTPYHPIINTGTAAGSVYGNFGMVFTFNDAGKITAVNNFYGQPSPGPQFRSAVIDATGINSVYANKDFRVKYKMLHPGLGLAGDIRVLMDENWIYKGPR